jgi:hypothetical protein
MKNRLISGIILVVLGALIALGPITIFPVCGIGDSHAAEMGDGEQAMQGDGTDAQPAMGEGAHGGEQPAMGGSGGESSAESSTTVMKCFWTARAELGIGALIAIVGVLLIVLKSRQIRLGLSLAAALNGILALLVPTALIGVCGHASMQCRIGTLPALVILSSFVIIVAALNTVYLSKARSEKPVSE